MPKNLLETYRQIVEASVLPDLKKPGIGPGSGQHSVDGKMSVQTKTPQQAIANIKLDPTSVSAAADRVRAGQGANGLRAPAPAPKPVAQTTPSNTERRQASGDIPPQRQTLDKRNLSMAAVQAANRGRQIVQDRAKASVGAPAGGNYASAVKRNPSIAAREPDAKTGSTGGRPGLFGMAQARRDNQADAMNAKTRTGIQQSRRDANKGAAAVAYDQKTGEGIKNGIKQRNADAMAQRGKVAPTIAADNAAVAGTRGPETRDEKWKRSINDPRTQARANGDQFRPAPGTLGDKLQKTASGLNSPSESPPNAKAKAGQAQAATPAKIGDSGVRKTTNKAEKPADMSWSQKVGKAMRDHVKKGGKAGDTIMVDGKKIKVAWKDKAYQKRLTSKSKKQLEENRVVKKTAKSMLAHPQARLGKGQQSVSAGRRYRIRTRPLSEAEMKAGKKGKKVVVNFEPENNNPIQ